MAKLEKYNLKSLGKQMELISKTYFHYKNMLNKSHLLYDVEEETIDEFSMYVARVEDTYKVLDSLDQLIINNDYFHENYPYWWVKQYSTTTYYRYKKRAVVRFLKIFYEI